MNGDHAVDLHDVALEVANFGCATGMCPGDLDCDGDTDLDDLAIELAHYRESCS